jgi:hypothetical protein
MKKVTFQLKGVYFDQIIAGSKIKEYREVTEYNIKRLCYLSNKKELEALEDCLQMDKEIWGIKKDLTHVQFFNGYRADRREMICKLKSIKLKENPEGDTPGTTLFVLSLGSIVERKNF